MGSEPVSIAINDDELVAIVREGSTVIVEVMLVKRIPMELHAMIHLIEKRCGRSE